LTNEGATGQTGLGEFGSDMLQQTAQLANVEAMQRLTDLQGRLLGVQQFSSALGLTGKQVTAFVPGEEPVEGLVEAVAAGESGAVLRVGGRDISLEHVIRVDDRSPGEAL